jgi:hypothetical protein
MARGVKGFNEGRRWADASLTLDVTPAKAGVQ